MILQRQVQSNSSETSSSSLWVLGLALHRKGELPLYMHETWDKLNQPTHHAVFCVITLSYSRAGRESCGCPGKPNIGGGGGAPGTPGGGGGGGAPGNPGGGGGGGAPGTPGAEGGGGGISECMVEVVEVGESTLVLAP